jgi:hypothetical protein
MVDPITCLSTIKEVLLTGKAIYDYIVEVKNASYSQFKLISEISALVSILTVIHNRLEEARRMQNDSNFQFAMSALAVENGPLTQTIKALADITRRLPDFEPPPPHRAGFGNVMQQTKIKMKKAVDLFVWPFTDADIQEDLEAIERLKSLIQLSLLTSLL